MTAAPRHARVTALAKVNLGLKVLYQRPDGYHELRTIFQTVSLADSIDIEFAPARRTASEIRSSIDIPDNLVVRAANLALEAMRTTGRAVFDLSKRIPIGAGLGGGSSDAAAVLLTLPVLAGKQIPLPTLLDLAAQLGSDVPFFLLGGRAVALGRGTELYPLPEGGAPRVLLVVPDLHVPTPEAYQALRRELTFTAPQNMISSFQSCVWQAVDPLGHPALALAENDFESVVFDSYPRLKSLKRQLQKLGADPAMLSGSGSALFGVFSSPPDLDRARRAFRNQRIFPVFFVSRARYRSIWWRRLHTHIRGRLWPPQSRYV